MSRQNISAYGAAAAYACSMEHLFPSVTPLVLCVTVAIAVFAGTVKGLVGFAMPTIMILGFSTVMGPEAALATLILPSLVTNGMQALREGRAAAWQSLVKYRVFLLAGAACLAISAPLVLVVSPAVLFLVIGISVTGFSALQLLGWQPNLRGRSRLIEAATGGFTGLMGGVSGIWAPSTVAYLTALNTPKVEQVRVQGVVFGLGALALFGAHLKTGVMSAATAPLSALMVIPAIMGMLIGARLRDRVDQASFKRITLVLLCLGGLNLIRRGAMG